MNKILFKLSLILGILLIGKVIYTAFLNNIAGLKFIYCPFFKAVHWNLEYILLAFIGATIVGTTLIALYFINEANQKLKKHQRTAEKASINSEESTDKVKILEAKIQTLEIALKEALSKNN